MPEELEDEFGDIIKKARAGMGYNPDVVAHMTSISVDDIADMETYKRKPSLDQVKVLASVLDLNADNLAAIADGTWHPQPRDLNAIPGITVERIRVPFGAYGSNCYVLGCVATNKGAVVDPGGAVDEIMSVLRQNELALTTVLITHGHMDHTGGLSEICRRYPSVTIVVSSDERVHGPEVRHPEDGEEFSLGNLIIRSIATPGHTSGSTSYYVTVPGIGVAAGLCFVGDTLFAGSVGGAYTSPDAFRKELDSIRTKLLSLPDDTVILPGHGPATTVGEEKENNPFFVLTGKQA